MRAIDKLYWTVVGGIVSGAAVSLFGGTGVAINRLTDAPVFAATFGAFAAVGMIGLMVSVGLLRWSIGQVDTKAISVKPPSRAVAVVRDVNEIQRMMVHALIPAYVAAGSAVFLMFLLMHAFGKGPPSPALVVPLLVLFGVGFVGQPIALGFLLKKVEAVRDAHGDVL